MMTRVPTLILMSGIRLRQEEGGEDILLKKRLPTRKKPRLNYSKRVLSQQKHTERLPPQMLRIALF